MEDHNSNHLKGFFFPFFRGVSSKLIYDVLFNVGPKSKLAPTPTFSYLNLFYENVHK